MVEELAQVGAPEGATPQAPGSEEAERSRLAELSALLGDVASRVSSAVGQRAQHELAEAERKLALGLDHRVVALVGGTGSGKSSLFNAISGLDVADVGVRRPTTSLPTASVWGSQASELLDHLAIEPERRFRGELALAGPEPGLLDGIVLIDVPDHDSVAESHRAEVDRLIPEVDLLVWVLDPQKYADDRLHAGYLTQLRGRTDGMLVVINQSDTLSQEGLGVLRLDVARLLVSEGLGDLQVLTTSARTGAGIPELREAIRRRSEHASLARTAMRERLDGVARLLRAELGTAPGPGVDVAAGARRLAEAMGVAAAADALALGRGGSAAMVRAASPERLASIRAEWVRKQTVSLAPRWRDAVTAAMPSAAELGELALAAASDVPRPSPAAVALGRLRPGALAAARERVRDGFQDAVVAAIEARLVVALAPSQAVRAELAAALEATAGQFGAAA